MRRTLLAGLALLAGMAYAHAQSAVVLYGPNGPIPVTTAGIPVTGTLSTTPGATVAASTVQATCTTTSSVIYTGGSATHGFLRIVAQPSNTVNGLVNWAGATATPANTEAVPPGTSFVWGALTNSISCITASGSAVFAVTQ